MGLPSSNGKLVAEYSTADVTAWLDSGVTGISAIATLVIIACAVLGLALFLVGITTYMRASRESPEMGGGARGGGGGGGGGGVTMMLVGAALGAIDLIAIALFALMRPGG